MAFPGYCMARCIGLDVGSTSLKAAVLNLDTGNVERIVSTPFPAPAIPQPGRFENDVEVVAGLCRQLLADLLLQAPDCRDVYTCGQMGGLVLVDSRGRPHTPYMSWRDQRTLDLHRSGKSYFDSFRSRLSPSDLDAIGQELRVGSTINLLAWLVETGQPPAAGLVPVTLVDAVIARLCECSPATEPTQALGLLNLSTRTWHEPLFAAAGVSGIGRSRITDITDCVGVARIDGHELRCHPGIGDQQAALAGVDFADDELSINCSTGSQVSRIARRIEPGDYQIRPYFGGRVINTVAQLPAGRSLNVIVDLLTELARAEGVELKRVWETIAARSALSPPEELEVDLAFFAGPMGDHGSVQRITTENFTAGALFRAAFRNMADNYLKCAQRVSSGRPWTRAVISGGLTNKLSVLREMITARLGTPIRESCETEETMMGLLKLARGSV